MQKLSEIVARENLEYRRSGWPPMSNLLLFLCCLFFFQPIIAMLVLVICCLRLHGRSILLLFVLATMISFYLGLLNVTKQPISDLGAYLRWLALARELDLLEFMAINPKEPAYYTYMYLLSHLPGSSDGLFVFVSTAMPYGILLVALARLAYRFGLPNHAIVGALIFFAFFSPLFNNSAHLMRQFLAGALIAWFYIEFILGTRGSWLIMVLAVLTHTTAGIFLPLAIIGSIRRYSLGTLLTIASLALLFILVLLKFAGYYLTSVPYLGDIIQRILAGVYVEHAPLGQAPLLMLCCLSLFSLYQLYTGIRSREKVTRESAHSLYIATLFISLFVGWAHLSGETMLATRFLLYLYFLSGPLLVLALAEMPNKKIFTGVALTVMPIYFIYTVVNGVWTYEADGIWISFARLIYLNS